MDERVLQLKQMKKAYKKLRARAGRGWKLLAWLFLVLCLLLTVVTVFVLLNHWPAVQYVDTRLWEPLKKVLNLGVDYAYFWRLAERYGVLGAVCSGVLSILFAVIGGCAAAKTKRTDEYLSYRTLKLTLKTEKEEK